MEHFQIAHFQGPAATLPAPLTGFLKQVEHAGQSTEVWEAFRAFSKSLGLPAAVYFSTAKMCPTLEAPAEDLCLSTQTPEQNSALRGLAMVQDLLSGDPMKRCLQPAPLHGLEENPPARPPALDAAGMRSALAIPVISSDLQGQAVFVVGGQISAAEFEGILAQCGHWLYIAAMTTHARFCAHYKREFPERAHLTAKQTELVGLVGLGLLDKQIAHQLGISFSAVRQRLAAVQHKTGARNRAHLAALAMRINLTPDPLLVSCKIAAE